MELLLIRHGQSENNALVDPRQRVCDPALTEHGQEQVRLLVDAMAGKDGRGPWLNHCRIDRLFCSPMIRALQTAQPVSRALGITAEVWIDVHEQGGVFLEHENERIVGYPGVTRDTMRARFPEYAVPDGLTAEGWWKGSKEDAEAWCARAARVASKLTSFVSQYTRIAVISHGGFIDTLLKTLLNQIPGDNLYYDHDNTSVTCIVFADQCTLQVKYMNRVDHLSCRR